MSREECERLHEEMQLLLMLELQKGNHQRREEERIEALLARIHTQMELLIGLSLTHMHTRIHTLILIRKAMCIATCRCSFGLQSPCEVQMLTCIPFLCVFTLMLLPVFCSWHYYSLNMKRDHLHLSKYGSSLDRCPAPLCHYRVRH